MAAIAGDSVVDQALVQDTVQDAEARAVFLAAVREAGRDGEEFTLERLQRLIAVDERFHEVLATDQIEFLRQPTTISESDREFALSVQRTCLEAANGFQRFLRNRAAWATTPESMEGMFRVTGLALNAIHSFVKWGYFLNEPGRSVPWKQIHALYLLADNDGYAQAPFVLHAARPAFRPSVQTLYLRTLLLDLLNSGSLSKLQVEIADGWLCAWCADYGLDTEYSPERHLFYLDLASESGLHLMRADSQGEAVRYVGAEALKAQIEEVQTGLRHGQPYAGHGAGAAFPVEAHVALLEIVEKLYYSIHSGSGSRIEERTHFEDREVDVTVGFERLVRKVRGMPGEAAVQAAPEAPEPPLFSFTEPIEIMPSGLSLVPNEPEGGDAPLDELAADRDIERWRVHDLSSKGFGLIVDRDSSDSVLLNGIVGVRNHEVGAWMVGTVVRKLPNRVRGEMLVGVEVLCFRPVPVELLHVTRGVSVTAFYMPGPDTSGKLDSILLRSADFTSDNVFELEVAGARYRINLNRILRKGADWIKARFEIQSKA